MLWEYQLVSFKKEEMMQIMEGKEQTWQKVLDEWTGDLNEAVLAFAKRWAERMEAEFGGEFNAEIAQETKEEEILVESLSNHMYCGAVYLLAQVWVFGEELRQWHNIVRSKNDLSLAIKANMEGGVIFS